MKNGNTSAVFDARTKTVEDVVDLYGIEIDEDNMVYDPFSMSFFDTLLDWAISYDADAAIAPAEFKKRTSRSGYDD